MLKEQRAIPRRGPAKGMHRRIPHRIGLGFHNPSADNPLRQRMHQDFAQQEAGKFGRILGQLRAPEGSSQRGLLGMQKAKSQP
jgi:hypothetical protein